MRVAGIVSGKLSAVRGQDQEKTVRTQLASSSGVLSFVETRRSHLAVPLRVRVASSFTGCPPPDNAERQRKTRAVFGDFIDGRELGFGVAATSHTGKKDGGLQKGRTASGRFPVLLPVHPGQPSCCGW